MITPVLSSTQSVYSFTEEALDTTSQGKSCTSPLENKKISILILTPPSENISNSLTE